MTRFTPLRSKTPLARSALKRRTPMPRPTKPLNKRSRKQGRREREWSAMKRQAIAERGDVCEPCLTHPDARCSGRADHAHHKAGRGEGRQALELLLLAGGWHHQWITDNGKAAIALGWSVSRNEVTDEA